MMDKFDMDNIRSGYVIVLRNEQRLICVRTNDKNYTKIFVDEYGNWAYASSWDEYGKFKFSSIAKQTMHLYGNERAEDYDIVEVYGLVNSTHYYGYADTTNLDSRTLLWKRKTPVRMTIKDVCKRLGIEDLEIILEAYDETTRKK